MIFSPKAYLVALALLSLSSDGNPLPLEKDSSQQQQTATQKLLKPPAHLNYETVPNHFIIQFSSSVGLSNILKASTNPAEEDPKLTKRSSTVGDATKNKRFRDAVKKVISARTIVNFLSQEAKEKGYKMKVLQTYDSDILQGAEVTLTEEEMLQLSHSELIESIWPVVSSTFALN
jgi:hypothetical protein